MNLTNEDLVGSLIPNVYISRIILESTPTDKLRTNIQFVLKEHYGNDDISSWLEDSEVLKHLSIFVIQSTDPGLTELFQILFEATQLEMQGSDFISNSLTSLGTILGNYGININQSDLLGFFRWAFYSESSFNRFKQLLSIFISDIDKKLNYKEIKLLQLTPSLKQLVKEGKAELVEEDDGTRTYNVFIDLDFGLEGGNSALDENVQNLSYLFGSFYSLLNLMSTMDNITDQPVDFFTLGVTDMKVENVIVSGEIASTTYIFVDNFDMIWPGKVHTIIRTNSQNIRTVIYRSGESESENSVDLRRVEIPNNKIQDFRQLRNIKEMQRLDTRFLQDSVLNAFEDTESMNGDLMSNTSAISDCYLSTDQNSKSSISFFIDFRKMFIQNSTHGNALYKKNTANAKALIQSFYKMCNIEQIVVKSKRIDLDDSLSEYKNTEEIVGSYGTEQIAEIEKKINLQSLTDDQAEQIRMFSITDRGEPKKTGIYEYSVEISYKDNVPSEIKKIVDDLKKEHKAFSQYYTFCSLPSNFNERVQRFFAQSLNGYVYADPMMETVNLGIQEITNFAISGRTYLSVLEQIYNTSANSVLSTINEWLNPNLGTPVSVSYVLNLYEDLINQLEKVILINPFVNNSLNDKGESAVELDYVGFHVRQEEQDANKKDSSKTVIIKKTFKNTLDLTYPYRFEFLNLNRREITQNINSDPFLHEILKAQLIERKLKPVTYQTYLKDSNSYREDFNKKITSLFNDFANLRITKEPQIQNTNINFDRMVSMPVSIDRLVQSALLEQTLNNSSEQVTDIHDIDAVNKTLLTLLGPTVSGDSENAKFNINVSNNENMFWKIRPNSATIVNGATIENLFYGCRFNKNIVKDLPNQIKSLIKTKLNSPTGTLSDAQVRFKYELIKKVVYLRGFQYDLATKTFDMSQETWSTLNNIEDVFGNNRYIFCKLIDYTNDSIKYKFNKALSSGVVNEFFLLNKNGMNNNGYISNGATHITKELYENRCNSETKLYFNDEEQPPVQIVLNGTILNNNDSYSNTKYAYLSPVGFYMDGSYKSLIPQGMAMLTIVNTIFQETTPTETSMRTLYDRFSLKRKPAKINPYINKFRSLNASVYSSNNKKKGTK